jgi:hypothetical protein
MVINIAGNTSLHFLSHLVQTKDALVELSMEVFIGNPVSGHLVQGQLSHGQLLKLHLLVNQEHFQFTNHKKKLAFPPESNQLYKI